MYPTGRSLHSTSPAPAAWCQTALKNLSVCSTPAAFTAVLKWPHLTEEAVLMHTVACPFCYFRWNTVMHSAVTHHSQGKRLFQSCLRCSQSSLGGGGAPTWTTVCPGVRRGGDSSTQASGWGWTMGCSGSKACLSAPCAAERVTSFYIVPLCSEE